MKTKAAMPKVTWLAASHQVGYHDQMHMIRDFREFAADVPTGIFGRVEELLVPPDHFAQAAGAR